MSWGLCIRLSIRLCISQSYDNPTPSAELSPTSILQRSLGTEEDLRVDRAFFAHPTLILFRWAFFFRGTDGREAEPLPLLWLRWYLFILHFNGSRMQKMRDRKQVPIMCVDQGIDNISPSGLQRHIRRRSGTGTCDSGRACASHCSSRSLSAATVRKKSKRSSTRRWTRICLTLDPRNIALSTEIRAYARRRRARPSPRLAWLASCAAQLAAACTSSSANNKCR
jgi:hypothetical protein